MPLLRDVPCVHAAGFRRVSYEAFRASLLELRFDRQALKKEQEETHNQFKQWKRSPLACRSDDFRQFRHSLSVLDMFCKTGSLPRRDDPSFLSVRPGKTTDIDDCHRLWRAFLTSRILDWEARRDAMLERASHLHDVTKSFAQHLRHSPMDCNTSFLCTWYPLDRFREAIGDLHTHTEGHLLCYLCRSFPAVRGDADPSCPAVPFMCISCYQHALEHGLCAFCLGHVDEDDAGFDGEGTCRGRADYKCRDERPQQQQLQQPQRISLLSSSGGGLASFDLSPLSSTYEAF